MTTSLRIWKSLHLVLSPPVTAFRIVTKLAERELTALGNFCATEAVFCWTTVVCALYPSWPPGVSIHTYINGKLIEINISSTNVSSLKQSGTSPGSKAESGCCVPPLSLEQGPHMSPLKILDAISSTLPHLLHDASSGLLSHPLPFWASLEEAALAGRCTGRTWPRGPIFLSR